MTSPESALAFNPLEHRLRQVGSGSQISSTPENSHLLRWICNGERMSPLLATLNDSSQLQQAALLRRQHLDVLGSHGLNIPEHTSFIAPCVQHVGKIALYDVVERVAISSQLVDHVNDPEPVQANITQLGESLAEYLDWVVASKQTHFMRDIFLASQHAIDTHGRTTLLDIDPLFMNVDEQLAEGSMLEYARFDTIHYLDGNL